MVNCLSLSYKFANKFRRLQNSKLLKITLMVTQFYYHESHSQIQNHNDKIYLKISKEITQKKKEKSMDIRNKLECSPSRWHTTETLPCGKFLKNNNLLLFFLCALEWAACDDLHFHCLSYN